jgi:hypothetical protein
MAHFAEIDKNGIVLRVLVVSDEQEHRGQDFLASDLGLGGTWVQTSYNARIRKNYAGVGARYDSELDAFIPPKAFDSWILNKETCQWEAPVPRPDSIDGEIWNWNEEKLEWELLNV